MPENPYGPPHPNQAARLAKGTSLPAIEAADAIAELFKRSTWLDTGEALDHFIQAAINQETRRLVVALERATRAKLK